MKNQTCQRCGGALFGPEGHGSEDCIRILRERVVAGEAFIKIYEDQFETTPYGGHAKGCFSCCDVDCDFHDNLNAAWGKWDDTRKESK